MQKRNFAYLLAFAPLLMGADQYGQDVSALIVNSLPTCADSEYLTYTANGLSCTSIQGGSLSVPDCKTSGQLLTYTMNGEIGVFACTAKGMNSLSDSDIQTINTKYQELVNLNTQITNIEKNPSSPAAKYCGQTPGQPNGAFSDNGATGIAAAASLCSKVAACGTGARMCSVYDMFVSVATGAITNQMDVSKSWVYHASWSQEFADNSGIQKEPGSGQSDNCGGGTYGTGDKHWYGSAIQWTVSDTGKKALKVFSGPANVGVPGTNSIVANPGAVPCSTPSLPIACCK